MSDEGKRIVTVGVCLYDGELHSIQAHELTEDGSMYEGTTKYQAIAEVPYEGFEAKYLMLKMLGGSGRIEDVGYRVVLPFENYRNRVEEHIYVAI